MNSAKWVKNTLLFPGDGVNLKFDLHLLGVTFKQKSKNIFM